MPQPRRSQQERSPTPEAPTSPAPARKVAAPGLTTLPDLQHAAGNQVVLQLLAQRAPATPVIRRLMTADAYRRKYGGLQTAHGPFYRAVYTDLLEYERTLASPARNRLPVLRKTRTRLKEWLAKKAAGWQRMTPLDQELEAEMRTVLAALAAEDQQLGGNFVDANATSHTDSKYGASLSTLDEINYGFGVANDQQVAGTFTGLFKADVAVADLSNTRGGGRVLPDAGGSLRLTERNLATYAIDRLLAADLIPSTYRAAHTRLAGAATGFVMEKVEGTGGDSASQLELSDPIVRRGLSNLYLLDLICGQVDRHRGNFIVEKDPTGTIIGVKGIDNDLAFVAGAGDNDARYGQSKTETRGMGYSGFVSAGKSIDALTEIDKDFALKIIQLAKEDWLVGEALQPLLEAREIAASLARLQDLARILQELISSRDTRVKVTF